MKHKTDVNGFVVELANPKGSFGSGGKPRCRELQDMPFALFSSSIGWRFGGSLLNTRSSFYSNIYPNMKYKIFEAYSYGDREAG